MLHLHVAAAVLVEGLGERGITAAVLVRRAGWGAKLFEREEVAPVVALLDLARSYWFISLIAAGISFWFARSLNARAYVKVQRD